jgi:hypothetical protein
MSGRDDGADREQGFLGRWIKRKAEVQEQSAAEIAAKEDQSAPAPSNEGAQALAADTAKHEPAFDLSTLPKLDEITAQTKITDFMRREVPAALRNAALRQAWAIDPVIRDAVNPAREYAYDWNIPGGVPGNGPIEAGYDALKQVAEAFSRPIDDHTFGLRENTTGEQHGTSPLPSAEPELAAPVRMSDIKKNDYSSENEDKNIISDVAHEEPLPIAQDVAAPRRRHGGASPV